MAKVQESIKARHLRKQGYSISTIAQKLSVAKSSVSVWCTDIELSKEQKRSLYDQQVQAGNVGRMKGAQKNKENRLLKIARYEKEAQETIGSLNKKDLLMLGIGLYWGEGAKSRSDPAAIVNSDPDILVLSIRWFTECLGVRVDDFRPYVYINHQHKDREHDILKHWVKVLKIPAKQFHTIVIKNQNQKKIYENRETYFGVVSLRVSRGTDLKYKILGLMKACNLKKI